MRKEEVLLFLRTEIEDMEERVRVLIRTKASADNPRTSWHSQIHLDVEREMEILRNQLVRLKSVLSSVGNVADDTIIGNGSIVLLDIGGENQECIMVNEGGGSIGEYFVISTNSPIGEAVWGKSVGFQAKVKTPGGLISVRILRINQEPV